MPPQKAKNLLVKKYGDKALKAHKAHATDETVYSAGGDLPVGVSGVARLVDCRFGEYEKGDQKGQLFFIARASVIEPKTFVDHKGNTHRTEGKYTQIMESMGETPSKSRKTFDEHYAWVLNELRKMDVATDETTVENIDEVLEALKESGPVIKFRTWGDLEPRKDGPYKGKPPLVNHAWEGTDKEFAGVEAPDVVDETAPAADDDVPELTDEEPADDDLDALADAAENDDKEAQSRILELAKAANILGKVRAAPTWTEGVEFLKGAEPEADEEPAADDEPADEDSTPVVGGMYFFQPMDPKTKKKGKKVECEILTVSKKNETVTIKNTDTGKPVIGADKKPLPLKWTDLIHE